MGFWWFGITSTSSWSNPCLDYAPPMQTLPSYFTWGGGIIDCSMPVQPDHMGLNGGDWHGSQRKEQTCLQTGVPGRCRRHWQSQFNQHLRQDLAPTFFLFLVSSGRSGNAQHILWLHMNPVP